MKFKLIIIFLFFFSCKSRVEVFDFEIFTVKDRSFKELNRNGFVLTNKHVTALEKNIFMPNFGIVRLYYVIENSKPNSRTIELNIKKNDAYYLDSLFNQYKCKAITKIDKNIYGSFSLLVENENSQIFHCNYSNERNFNFSITYSYDNLTKEDIEELGYWGELIN